MNFVPKKATLSSFIFLLLSINTTLAHSESVVSVAESNQYPNRVAFAIDSLVGDSPIMETETYAQSELSTVSVTRHSEYLIRHNAKSDDFETCTRVKIQCLSLKEAATPVIDSKGIISMPFYTTEMYRASLDTQGNLTESIYKN